MDTNAFCYLYHHIVACRIVCCLMDAHLFSHGPFAWTTLLTLDGGVRGCQGNSCSLVLYEDARYGDLAALYCWLVTQHVNSTRAACLPVRALECLCQAASTVIQSSFHNELLVLCHLVHSALE
jgi:hypothetical protein